MDKGNVLKPKTSSGKVKCKDGAVTGYVENDLLGMEGLAETPKDFANLFEAIRRLPRLVEKSEQELKKKDETVIQLEKKLSEKQEQVQMMTITMSNDGFLLEQIRKEKHDLERTNTSLSEKNDALMKEKEKMEAELINCKGRLSRYLGNKLTENNPGIADLSNENRPNKLGERFSELYDNQWTDAFEDLDNCNPKNEQANIETLLDILMEAYDMCKEISEKQHDDLRKMAYLKPFMKGETPETLHDKSMAKDAETYKESEDDDDKEGSSTEKVLELNKQVKEFRRYTATLALDAVQEMFTERIRHNGTTEILNKYQSRHLTSYIKECVEICWLMNVQEPPVVLAPVPEILSKVNLDLYRHYMRSGPCVEFLVWPAMLLHEGGPTIMKGVVQGCAADTAIRPKNEASQKATNEEGKNEKIKCEDNEKVPDKNVNGTPPAFEARDEKPTEPVEIQHEKVNPVYQDFQSDSEEMSVNNDRSEDKTEERTEDEFEEASSCSRTQHENDDTESNNSKTKMKNTTNLLPQTQTKSAKSTIEERAENELGDTSLGGCAQNEVNPHSSTVDGDKELTEESVVPNESQKKKKKKKKKKHLLSQTNDGESMTSAISNEDGTTEEHMDDASPGVSAEHQVKPEHRTIDDNGGTNVCLGVTSKASKKNKTNTSNKNVNVAAGSSSDGSTQHEVKPETSDVKVTRRESEDSGVKNEAEKKMKHNEQPLQRAESKGKGSETGTKGSKQSQIGACDGKGDSKESNPTTNTGKTKQSKMNKNMRSGQKCTKKR